MSLIRFSDLRSKAIQATDERLGSMEDLFFDDQTWSVRYFVIETSKWFSHQAVLVSPKSVSSLVGSHSIAVNLSAEQIKACPPPETDEPISRQYERTLSDYYGWPMYWDVATPVLHPFGSYLGRQQYDRVPHQITDLMERRRRDADPHLRSCKEVIGYRINADDGEFGRVDGFLIDPETWEIPYLLVDTGSWLPGKKVIVPQHLIYSVRWSDRRISVLATKHLIETSPKFKAIDGDSVLEKKVMEHYFTYFDRPGLAVAEL